MKTNYIAITIGPIYETMMLCRKTREFWGASLLFSLLSKELCQQLLTQDISEDDFIVPHKSIFSHDLQDIGLYLDRIVCKNTASLTLDDLNKNIIMPALDNLSEKVIDIEPSLTVNVLKSYFKIYAVISDSETAKPLKSLSDTLNVLELHNSKVSENSYHKEIKRFLENVNTEYKDGEDGGEIDDSLERQKANSFLREYFTQQDFNSQIRIPSILEISTQPLRGITPLHSQDNYTRIFNKNIWKKKPTEDKVIPELKASYGQKVKNYHKYYAILQADGDRLGGHLMESDEATAMSISAELIRWAKNDAFSALHMNRGYGALPVYIGGDDVFCFCPINNGSQNILEVAFALNQSFITKKGIDVANATLSISLQLSYYKSPMYESYQKSFPLLREVAKEYIYVDATGEVHKADTCTVSMDLHSGQPHQFSFSFKHEYKQFIEPLMNAMTLKEEKKSFLTSVMYALRANEEILFFLYSQSSERFWHFFENNFDEAKPDREETDEFKFIKAVSDYLFDLFRRYGDKKGENEKPYFSVIQLFSALKIIRFIKGLDYDR